MIAIAIVSFLVVLGLLMLAISSGLRFFEAQRRRQLVSVLRTVSEIEETHVELLIDPEQRRRESGQSSGVKAIYEKVNRIVTESGLEMTMTRLITLTIAASGVGCILGILVPFESPAIVRGLAGGLGFACLPLMYVKKARTKRLDGMEAQLPDALDFLARSMRAGHAFTISLEMVGEEIHEPLGPEFRALFNEAEPGCIAGSVAGELRQTRAPFRCTLFLVRGAAAGTDGRQPGRSAWPPVPHHPRTVPFERTDKSHQRARAVDGHDSDHSPGCHGSGSRADVSHISQTAAHRSDGQKTGGRRRLFYGAGKLLHQEDCPD